MDIVDVSRMFFGLLAVLAMIGLCAAAARKLGVAGSSFGARTRRLQLVETLALDARRRLAIVRCDGKEHLILLGATSEMLVEAGIAPRTEADEPLPQAFPIADALKRFRAGVSEEKAA